MLACDRISFGCEGGYPHHAWRYWHENGVVTGGPYGSNKVSTSKTIFEVIIGLSNKLFNSYVTSMNLGVDQYHPVSNIVIVFISINCFLSSFYEFQLIVLKI